MTKFHSFFKTLFAEAACPACIKLGLVFAHSGGFDDFGKEHSRVEQGLDRKKIVVYAYYAAHDQFGLFFMQAHIAENGKGSFGITLQNCIGEVKCLDLVEWLLNIP